MPRVPPPGVMPTPQNSSDQPSVPTSFWEEGEKRRKSGGKAKKRFKATIERSSPCPNVDVRSMQNDKSGSAGSGQGGPGPPSSGPSFMDDPSGYLEQQTALLNNTMAGGGMGQFSPQAPGISPRPPAPSVPHSATPSANVMIMPQQQLQPQSQAGTLGAGNCTVSLTTQVSSSPAVVPLPSNVPLPARVSKAATQTTNTVMTTPTVLPSQSSHINSTRTTTPTFTLPVTSIANSKNHHIITASNDVKNVTVEKSNNQLDGTVASSRNGEEGVNFPTKIAKGESSSIVQTTTVTYTLSSTLTTVTKITNSGSVTTQAGCSHHRDKGTRHCFKAEDHSHKIKRESNSPIENLKPSPVTSSSISMKEFIKVDPCYKVSLGVKQCESGESSPEQCPISGPSSTAENISANKPLTPGPPGVSTVAGVTQSPLEMVQSIVSSIPVPSSLGSLRPSPQQQSLSQIPPQPLSQPQQQQQPQLSQQQQQPQPPPPPPPAPVPVTLSPGIYNGPISTNVTVYGGGGSGGLVRASGSLLVNGPTATQPVFATSSGGCNGPANMVVVSSHFNKGTASSGVTVTSGVAGVVGVQATVPQMQVQQQLTPMQQHIQPQLQSQLQPQLQPHLQQHLQPQLQPQIQPQLQQFQPVQPVVQLVNTFATMQTPVIIQNGGNIIQSSAGLLHSPGGMITGPANLPQGTIMAGQSLVPATPATLAVESTAHQHHQHQAQVGPPQSSPHLQVAQVVTTGLTREALEDARTRNASTPLGTSGSTPSTPHSTPGSTPGSDTPSSGGSSGGRRRKRRRNTSTPQGLSTSQSSPQQHQQPQGGLVPAIIMGNKVPQHMVMNGPHMTQMSPYGTMGTMAAAGQMAQVATVTSQVGGGQMLQAAAAQGTGAINVVQMVGNTLPNLPVQVHNPPAIVVGSAPAQGVVINQLADGTFISTDPNTGMSYPVQLQLSGGHIVGVTPAGSASGGMVGPLAPGPAGGGMAAMVAVRPPVPHTTTVVSGAKVVNISPSPASTQLPGGAGVHVLPVTAAPANYQPAATSVSPGQAVCVGQVTAPSVVVTSEYVGGQPVVISGSTCNNSTTVVQHKTTIVQQRTTLVTTQGGDEAGTHSSVSTQTPGGLGESDVSSSDCVSTAPPPSPSHQSAEVTTTRHDEDATPPMEPPLPLPSHTPEKNKAAIPEEPHSASTSGETPS